jgi:integrase
VLDLQASDVELLVALVRGVRDAMGYTGGSGTAVVHGLLDQKAVTGLAKRALHSLNYSTDLYLGDLALSGKSDETRRKYRYVLDEFSDMFEHLTPAEVGEEQCRRFLARWADSSPSTLALHVSVLRCFFLFLKRQKIVAVSPMENIDRPRRPHPEDLDVVSNDARDVRRMFDAVETWQEFICLGVFCYAGVRRRAAATARWRDVDLEQGTIKFREKGGKVIVKPIADELAQILHAADEAGVWESPNAWLIPNFENLRGRKASLVTRSNRIVYDTVKRVAARAGVESHCHALRAAFAVQFDEANPGHTIALKELLGHSRIETTMVYLRRKDKQQAMETVRTLSWGDFPVTGGTRIPPAGFEPALPANHVADTVSGEPAPVVPAPLQAKLDQLSQAAKQRQAGRR